MDPRVALTMGYMAEFRFDNPIYNSGEGGQKRQNYVQVVVECPLRQKPMLDNIFLLEKKQEWLNQLERSKESKYVGTLN